MTRRAAPRAHASQSIVDILPIMYKEFVEDGYIIVYQDIRGLHNSEGQFVMNRPIVGPLNKTGIDESTDAYDTIDWLVKNVPESNGKVGSIGSSYLGFLTLASEINPHPALKAAVPQSPMVDGWMGDDWFHNGAFRTGSLDFAVSQSTGKGDGGGNRRRAPATITPAISRQVDGRLCAPAGHRELSRSSRSCSRTRPTPTSGGPGGRQMDGGAAADRPDDARGRAWDQEDSYGAPAVYRALKDKYEGTDLLHLVIGPWRHSGANHYGYELGALTFNGDTAPQWRTQ